MSRRRIWGEVARWLVLGAGAVFVLLPFAWMLSISFKDPAEIFDASASLLPRSFVGFSNYATALQRIPVLHYLLNGVIVCSFILALQILVAIPAAYAIAKLQFRGKPLLMALIVVGLLIPAHVPAIPLYVAVAQAGLLNSYTALVAPFVISVFGIFLFRQFFMATPDDYIEAARVDGCREFTIVWRIVLPMAWPAVTAFAVFSVVAHWNDLFWPLIVVNSPDYATPPLGVVFFRNAEAGDEYGALMAASFIITMPLVIGFVFIQNAFIQGMSTAGLK